MFKTSITNTAPNLFNSFSRQLNTMKQKEFHDTEAWHNVFHEHITSKIDEDIFSVLFDSETGRANAPIRRLVGMMILKEGYGWSDAQLFEQCRFNILVMNAIGLTNLDDDVPTESTYYLLKQKIYAYQVETGKDLIGECFKKLTIHQAQIFGVNGEKLRMDSKLVGSNIATCSRLQLVISCTQAFLKDLNEIQKKKIPQKYDSLLKELEKQFPGQIVFRLSSEEKSKYLKKLGEFIMDIQNLFNEDDGDAYKIMVRVFEEQFSIETNEITIKGNKEISSKSLQSPHDPEATYRLKGDQKVQGYSVNMAETCSDEGLNLITSTIVEESTTADCDFLQTAIEESEEVVGTVNESYQDGAYHSQNNDEYGEKQKKTLYYTGFQGKKGRFEFKKQKGILFITDIKTNQVYEAVEYKQGKYKIKIQEKGKLKYKYFTDQCIKSFFKRKEVENLPIEIKNKRPNVEAAMFQLSFFMRNNKTRYRGKFKTQMWATFRSAWMNMVRIKNYKGGVCLKTPNKPYLPQNMLFSFKNCFYFLQKIYFKIALVKNFGFSQNFCPRLS